MFSMNPSLCHPRSSASHLSDDARLGRSELNASDAALERVLQIEDWVQKRNESMEKSFQQEKDKKKAEKDKKMAERKNVKEGGEQSGVSRKGSEQSGVSSRNRLSKEEQSGESRWSGVEDKW